MHSHPATSVMDQEQRFQFDNSGYLIVPNALTGPQLASIRETLDHPVEQWSPLDLNQGPLHWHAIWRELLDLPTISPYLEEMVGDHELRARRGANAENREPLPTYRLDHINIHTHVEKGFAGGMLHGGRGVNGTFDYHDGRFYNGLLTVSIELFDTHPNDGGFACIPGSHKANVGLPEHWRDLSSQVVSSVQRISAKPGDVIIFTEALIHGTLPWAVDSPRSTVFYKFSPHHASWGAHFYDPEDYRRYPDMDDRKLAILEPPNARYPGRPSRPRRRS